VKRVSAIYLMVMAIPVLLSGCGGGGGSWSQSLDDTWNKFTTPDFSWSQDRAVSADRAPGPTAAMAPPTPSLVPSQPSRLYRPQTRTTRPTRTASTGGCYRGRLTQEGSTCQAMRTDGGDLLTLAGPLRGFGAGDAVCVCGIPSDRQFCGQGLTLLIREIDTNCRDIR
jgi:hypothetical protein